MRNNVFARFARWILSWADPEHKTITGPTIYAIVWDGERVAEVSTNRHRVQAEALAAACRGEAVVVLTYAPKSRWSPWDQSGGKGIRIADIPARKTGGQ